MENEENLFSSYEIKFTALNLRGKKVKPCIKMVLSKMTHVHKMQLES